MRNEYCRIGFYETEGYSIISAYDFILANTVGTNDPEILKYLEDNWKLPEKWCIKITEDNRKKVQDWFESNTNISNSYGFSECMYYHFPEYRSHYASSGIAKGYTEITFDQLLKHVVKMENNKKIIGYKCPMDMPSINAKKGDVPTKRVGGWYMCDHWDSGTPAEIVEQWEPVYEEPKPELPEINGYKGKIKDGFVIYGCGECAKFSIEWLKSLYAILETNLCQGGNRTISQITLSSAVSINRTQLEQIITALEYKDN